MMNLEDYVPVAKLGKAQGLKGEVRVYPYQGMPDDLSFCREVLLKIGEREPQRYSLLNFRVQSKFSVARFSEVADRDAAECLTGAEMLVKEDLLPPADGVDSYWYDYVGLSVVTETGKDIGRVKKVFDNGAHPIIVVADGKQEYMIPITDEIVLDVDVPLGRIIVSLPEGLLEINE